MKRVFIIHGWGGYPEEGWFPWLKKELETRGFEVHAPQMPEANNPRIYNWVPALAKEVREADEQTYFVGHSMGCQTIARYLETLPEGVKVGGAVFVSGFFKRLALVDSDPIAQEATKHWLATPIDFKKVKLHLPKSVAIFSEDDPYVPVDNKDDYKNKLESEIVVVNGWRHFSGSDGTTEVPMILEKFLQISK